MRQNWSPLLVRSSSLVPITRPWLKRQQKSILSNSDFASHFKSIRKSRMLQNSEIKQFYIARRKAPLCQRLQIMWNSPKHSHTTSSTPAACKWADFWKKESIQHGKRGILLMPHIHKWSVLLICSPRMNKPSGLSHLCKSPDKELQVRKPHTPPVVCPNS